MNHYVHPASFETNNRTYSCQNNTQHILPLTAVAIIVIIIIIIIIIIIVLWNQAVHTEREVTKKRQEIKKKKKKRENMHADRCGNTRRQKYCPKGSEK
jgi:FtsZ-interacting cell division protein ZipA